MVGRRFAKPICALFLALLLVLPAPAAFGEDDAAFDEAQVNASEDSEVAQVQPDENAGQSGDDIISADIEDEVLPGDVMLQDAPVQENINASQDESVDGDDVLSDDTVLTVEAHVQNKGWMQPVSAAEMDNYAGTTGQNLNLEALRFHLNVSDGSNVVVSAHVSNIGWMEDVQAESVAGTTGRNLPIEALRIALAGPISDQYDVWYRVHSADFGWGGWACNGAVAGSQGFAKAAQAVQVVLLPKNSPAPGETENAFRSYAVGYQAHIQNVGWQGKVYDGSTAGTVGRNLNLESLRVSLGGYVTSGSIEIRAHVQDIGWQDWSVGAAGTTGRNLPIEALQFRLTGDAAEQYDVWYRVHSADYGWGGWASNGARAGTQGYAKPAQAVEIVLQAKGESAPGQTDGAFKSPSYIYSSHVSDVGWLSGKGSDSAPSIIIGTTGQAHSLQAFTLSYPGLGSGSVSYEAHVSEIGWQGAVSDGAVAGTTGRNLPIEAVRISLTGELADGYDIWYRAHVAEIGWLGWTSNGQPAGSEGLASHLEAIEVRLVSKADGEAPVPGTSFLTKPTITYNAYSAGTGWGPAVSNGGIAGATGQNRAVEAFSVSYAGDIPGGVSYRAHLTDIGWQDAVVSGTAGIEGGGKDLQAISISLTGDASKYFDIWYRVHIESFGWLGWTKNGADAGTTKLNLQVEAVQVTVTGKGAAAPGSTANAYFEKPIYIGWQNPPQYPQVSCNTVVLPSYCTGEFTYVSPSRIPYNATRLDCINAFIQRAYEYLGTRYIEPYSQAPGQAVDCSGLVMQCLYATGMDLGWYNPYNHRWLPEQTYNSMNWYRNNTFMPVSVSAVQRGDLLYYNGHVAIYIGNGQIIDSWPGIGVTIRGMYAPGSIIGAARPFVG